MPTDTPTYMEIFVPLPNDTQARVRIQVEELGHPTPHEPNTVREPRPVEVNVISGLMNTGQYQFEPHIPSNGRLVPA